ncbi:hypothetical protein PHMEG_00021484 [Phytophthora megakarya]|uniref:Uncharacterized protein n=1 Tax=Phytophthora megakarya TaxID=4795 RepID=A0A225VL38_9STRA|nr:hypothetical protein PHMEG_00021484 [Phytophthora megakarya]
MSLRDLAPNSTKHICDSAARLFKKFLAGERGAWVYPSVCMTRENAPLVLKAVVDKVGMYLAFKKGRKGELFVKKFLAGERGAWVYLSVCMTRENVPLVLKAVVDKFGMYLAFKKGRKGELFARHSVTQYYQQGKNWRLDQFPQVRQATDKVLVKKGQALEC